MSIELIENFRNKRRGEHDSTDTRKRGNMAFMLTLPLIGLEPRNFSALSTRLQCEIIEYQSPYVYEKNSPNTDDSDEGDKYYNGFDDVIDLKPSQSSSSIFVKKEQRKEKVKSASIRTSTQIIRSTIPNEKISFQEISQIRIIYHGRDILNLGANIRDPMWKTQDMWKEGFELDKTNRSIAQRIEEETRNEDTIAVCTQNLHVIRTIKVNIIVIKVNITI